MEDRITIDLHEGLADVRLTRADKMNALDDVMFGALMGDRREASRRKKAYARSCFGRRTSLLRPGDMLLRKLSPLMRRQETQKRTKKSR